MIKSLKHCLEKSYLPLSNHRRKCGKILFLNCVVAVVTGAMFLQYNYFNSTHSSIVQREIDKYIKKTEQKTTTRTALPKDPKAMFSIPPVPSHSTNDFVHPLQPDIMKKNLAYTPRKEYTESVVILTPIHDVAKKLPKFGKLLKSLTYPHNLISVAFGEDSSHDNTLSNAKEVADDLRKIFKNVDVFHFNITGGVSGQWSDIHRKRNQLKRRGHLAVARNKLMHAALKENVWALWIDSDISELPPDIIQQLLSSEKDIVVPACLFVSEGNNKRVFDKNTWRETPESLTRQTMLREDELMLEGYGMSQRLFLTDLRAEGRVVPIDGVGGCTLLIRGDNHRKGLKFPETVFNHHIETEGLGKMAKKMGYGVFGMPFVEVMH